MNFTAGKTTNIKAGGLATTALPLVDQILLCKDHINGFCRKGDLCNLSHQLCIVDDRKRSPLPISCAPNYLSLDPRLPAEFFEDDGPGALSNLGPRHDNDHVEIQDVRILPTTDEILSLRPPYMPSKNLRTHHHLLHGQGRLLDTNFRQLRYESVEALVDCCYHASQQLCQQVKQPHSSDYDYGMRTPKGSQYSLFRDIEFEEIIFNQPSGMMMRVSFACPWALRGRRMGTSGHFEKGMLVALVGLDGEEFLSVTFMDIHQRQTTEAMKRRTGNDLRGECSIPGTDQC